MKNKFLIGALMLISIMFYTQCRKDVAGPQGEKGETGANGATGTQGATGATGSTGQDGNANVISSTITITNWTLQTNFQYANITDANLTQNIVDNGIVMVYAGSSGNWFALPVTANNVANYFQIKPSLITIYYRNTDGTSTTNPGSKTFRMVYIPPSNRIANPNVNYNNYEEVKRTFNLPD